MKTPAEIKMRRALADLHFRTDSVVYDPTWLAVLIRKHHQDKLANELNMQAWENCAATNPCLLL